jgi:hypothetical protein
MTLRMRYRGRWTARPPQGGYVRTGSRCRRAGLRELPGFRTRNASTVGRTVMPRIADLKVEGITHLRGVPIAVGVIVGAVRSKPSNDSMRRSPRFARSPARGSGRSSMPRPRGEPGAAFVLSTVRHAADGRVAARGGAQLGRAPDWPSAAGPLFCSRRHETPGDVLHRGKPMAERVDVQELLNSYSRRLLHEFREGNLTSKVAFDRGLPREAAVRGFFESRLPGRYGVGEGLVIDTSGGQSEQCDVVVYDREMTPHLSMGTAMSVWPFESVYGIIQVKSVLTKNALDSAVANIGSFKCLSRPANRFAGGRGVYTAAGAFLNPPLGMLIAHTLDGSVPTGAAVQEVIKAAPREQQIDLSTAS